MSKSDGFELKTISPSAVQRAIEKAEQYRLLDDPTQAESICYDVLAVEPKNQRNLVTLILAITDQFAAQGVRVGSAQLKQFIDALSTEYDRAYYAGIVAERQARAYLEHSHARVFAYEGYRDAMRWYEKAAEIRPPGNDDAILRWNSCVRLIRRESLRPLAADERELPLE
jgi:hypothetical protein